MHCSTKASERHERAFSRLLSFFFRVNSTAAEAMVYTELVHQEPTFAVENVSSKSCTFGNGSRKGKANQPVRVLAICTSTACNAFSAFTCAGILYTSTVTPLHRRPYKMNKNQFYASLISKLKADYYPQMAKVKLVPAASTEPMAERKPYFIQGSNK